MKEWLKRFFTQNDADITLTLRGQTYKQSDCIQIGSGSEKHVYQIKGTDQCFFIPNKYRDEYNWNLKIQAEKWLLDEISELGLKTQNFEIVPLEIHAPGSTVYTLNVLTTRDFESLCQKESLMIYDTKSYPAITGTPPDFLAMKERFKDKSFAQEMLKKIIPEYALAYTFKLPATPFRSRLDDSDHLCFELSNNSEEPPIVRYMFWDVVADFGGVGLPIVPTLTELKNGPQASMALDALKILAERIACAMAQTLKTNTYSNQRLFITEVEEYLLSALNEDDILLKALANAKKSAATFLDVLLSQGEKTEDKLDSEQLVSLLNATISTGVLDLVERVVLLAKQPMNMPEECILEIMDIANKYEYKSIVDYLNINVVAATEYTIKVTEDSRKAVAEKEKLIQSHTLKNSFLQKYSEKLAADKGAWCGLYSFFATSNVNQNMSLADLVTHAQGLSGSGNGGRSRQVMKEMGWLDENNQVSNEVYRLLQ